MVKQTGHKLSPRTAMLRTPPINLPYSPRLRAYLTPHISNETAVNELSNRTPEKNDRLTFTFLLILTGNAYPAPQDEIYPARWLRGILLRPRLQPRLRPSPRAPFQPHEPPHRRGSLHLRQSKCRPRPEIRRADIHQPARCGGVRALGHHRSRWYVCPANSRHVKKGRTCTS